MTELFILNNLTFSKNNELLKQLLNNLEGIVENNTVLDKNIIKQLKNIINLLDKVRKDNENYFNSLKEELKIQIKKEFDSMGNNITGLLKKGFKDLQNDNSDIINGIESIKKEIQNLRQNLIINKEVQGIEIPGYGKYIGELNDDKIDGKGKMIYIDGTIYEGEFQEGKHEGEGKEIYNNGDKYKGNFKKGKREGKGIYYYYSGKWMGDIYEGEWKDDKRDGIGLYYCNSLNIAEMGKYSKGKRIGKHALLDPNGNIEIKDYGS